MIMAASDLALHLTLVLTIFAVTGYAFGPGLRVSWSATRNAAGDNSSVHEEEFFFHEQKVDHFAPEDSRVFKQKYFEILDFFQPPNGPIFLVMCGESTCSGGYGRTYVARLAKMFGAAIVTLEHRYYGQSSPFENFTVANMKYLSSKQSLFDHAVFVNYYQELINKKCDKQGLNQWLVIGVSYSGALSAWFRLKFPHLVVGSWASSAVVQSIFNYSAYDEQVGISAGPECKKLLQEITSLVETSLVKNATAIKSLFYSTQLRDVDFLSYVADGAASSVQYGRSDSLCYPLLNASGNATRLLEAYANYTLETIGESHLYDANVWKQQVAANNPDAKDSFSWTWQTCTEFAFFQVASGNDSVRSSRVNSEYFVDLCFKLFGKGTYPDVDTTNLYYGGWNISGSKIMFLNGSQDPWRHASKQIASAQEPTLILSCHTCAHGSDIRAICTDKVGSERCNQLEKAHAFIHSNIKKWLS